MRRIATRAVQGAILALAAFGATALGLYISDDSPPIRFLSARALDRSVPQGGTIDISFEVERDRHCASEAQRWLTDSTGTRHSIPSFTAGPADNTLSLGRDTYRRSITIPNAAAKGPAFYQVTISYTCNVVQRIALMPIVVTSPRIWFEITEATSIVPFGLPLYPPAAHDD